MITGLLTEWGCSLITSLVLNPDYLVQLIPIPIMDQLTINEF